MRVRRVSAFGASSAIHVVAVMAAIRLAAGSSLTLAPRPASTNEPTVVLVESLPPSESAMETDAPPDSLGIRVDEESSRVALAGFTFDFSKVALREHYDGVRLAILESILLTTPGAYRAGDARYLIGAIYWKQGRAATARRVWKEISVDPGDRYAIASTEIAAAMRAAEERGLDARRINRILEYEHGRWVSFSFDRLWEFGYRFDTF